MQWVLNKKFCIEEEQIFMFHIQVNIFSHRKQSPLEETEREQLERKWGYKRWRNVPNKDIRFQTKKCLKGNSFNTFL